MKNKSLYITYGSNRGVALLIAMLVAGTVLAVGFGVYSRTYKEILFSSYWRQAQAAFAATDAGFECALYWDTHSSASPTCFGSAIGWSPGGSTSGIDIGVYNSCVNIKIIKNDPNPNDTRIEARGYNDVCTSTNPHRVQRALKITY